MAAGSANTETVLSVDIGGIYHPFDAGLIDIYNSDDIDVSSGFRYSQVVSNANGNEVTTAMFAQYNYKMGTLRFSLSKMSAYTGNNDYVFRIPLIKNPSFSSAALRYNVTLYRYNANQGFPTIIARHENINEYRTDDNIATNFNPVVSAPGRNVQQGNVPITITLTGANNVEQYGSVIFKFDNKLKGIVPNFNNGGNTGNYNYYFFNRLNMMLVQKRTATTVPTITLGSNFNAFTYVTQFRIEWVRIMGPVDTNPRTLFLGTITTPITLNFLNSYAGVSLTAE